MQNSEVVSMIAPLIIVQAPEILCEDSSLKNMQLDEGGSFVGS
jgi:hypothetical protein